MGCRNIGLSEYWDVTFSCLYVHCINYLSIAQTTLGAVEEDTTLLYTTVPDTTIRDTTLLESTPPDTTLELDTTLQDTTLKDTTLQATTLQDTTIQEYTTSVMTLPGSPSTDSTSSDSVTMATKYITQSSQPIVDHGTTKQGTSNTSDAVTGWFTDLAHFTRTF